MASAITSFGIGGEAGSAISQIGEGAAAGCVAGPIGCGVGAATAAIKVGITDLTQHTARLQDAKNENAALDALIPAYDADMASVQAAFNSGAADAATCVSALTQVDSYIYQYLRQQVGKPGTAWGGPTTTALGSKLNPSYSAPCNSGCTAGCCVYLNNLRPPIFGHASQISMGSIQAVQQGGGTVTFPEVYPPDDTAYGNFSRAAYTLSFKAPPVAVSLVNSILGTSTAAPGASGAPATSFLSSLTGSESLAIITVVGGLILIITALFGQNALRVK